MSVWLPAFAMIGCQSRSHEGSPPAAAPAVGTTDAGRPIEGKTPADGGAGAPLASAGGAFLIWYGGANMFGSDAFSIDANLDARHEFRDGAGALSLRGPLRLTSADLAALEKVLSAHNVCQLKSAAGYLPVPEETQTTLSVALGSLRCVVSLYANEWTSNPAAAPIEKAIRALALRTQKIAPP